jgi:hypothetical protein
MMRPTRAHNELLATACTLGPELWKHPDAGVVRGQVVDSMVCVNDGDSSYRRGEAQLRRHEILTDGPVSRSGSIVMSSNLMKSSNV